MAFPQSVKAEALVACGRYCSICHSFCGTKIECHHIIENSTGGPDTFDNCIPVCFDCHSDMRSYDFKHPKGTKYTEDELRRHRDRWYAKVAAGGSLAALPEHVGVDKEVFAAFQKRVPYYPSMDYLKDRNFGFSFEREPLNPMFRYAYEGDRPEYEFIDPELEASRGEFVSAVRKFDLLLIRDTWRTDPRVGGIYSVPQEWEDEQPERFHRVIDEINKAADAVENAYASLIRTARRRLGVAGNVAGNIDSSTDEA